MRCEDFRSFVPPAEEATSQQLEHVRGCDECLLVALQSDSGYLFRSIGGEELSPEGGVEAFAAGVIQSISVREAERSLTSSRPAVSSWLRWTAAAAAVIAISVSGTLLFRSPSSTFVPPASFETVRQTPLVSQPVVEAYESPDATIVELPSDSEVQVVMVFDDTLPVDL